MAMQTKEIQNERKVGLSKDHVFPGDANKDGRIAPITVFVTDKQFRHDPEVEKELRDWYIQVAAIGAPTEANENRYDPKNCKWVNKRMTDEEATKLGLSEEIWVSEPAARRAKEAQEARDGPAVLRVGYDYRYGGLVLGADEGSGAARVARFEPQAQNEPTEVSAEQFRTILRDPKYELVHAVRNTETGELVVQKDK